MVSVQIDEAQGNGGRRVIVGDYEITFHGTWDELLELVVRLIKEEG